jgi:hypothetical protein
MRIVMAHLRRLQDLAFGTRPMRWNSSLGRMPMVLAMRLDMPKKAGDGGDVPGVLVAEAVRAQRGEVGVLDLVRALAHLQWRSRAWRAGAA